LSAIDELERRITSLRSLRRDREAEWNARLSQRIQTVFEAHPLGDVPWRSLLEGRIAQELALVLERTDIEEELTRFSGHLDQLRRTLSGSGPVGRKIDFLLQELNREINTLGNKAQDLAMGTEVVAMKLRLEQLREQAMNLE
jgi:uncharacterized protein (TIGR00255 family)